MWSSLVRRWRETREPAKRSGEAVPAPVAGPASAQEWIARGNAALGAGRLQEAREAYANAKQADPSQPAAWLNHGYACLESGQLTAAHEDFRQCLVLSAPDDPRRHELHFLIGQAYLREGKPEQAAAAWQAALAAAPAFEEARVALARLWLDAGQPERVPGLASAGEVRSLPFALALAQALHALGRHGESLAVLDQVLAQDPDCAPALDGRGVVLLDTDRAAEALASFERAARAGGANADRLGNLTAACQRLARLDEAIAHADQALALAPHDARTRWNRALSLLLQGELARGWEDFEARWEAGAVARDSRLRTAAAPWQGEDLRGHSILLDMEQGLGDMIQFLRYVPVLAERGAHVHVRVHHALLALARRSLPMARVLAPDEPPPAVDFYCELMSVPRHAGVALDTIPARVPYLQADPAAVRRWQAEMAGVAPGRPRVGLAWSGNPAHLNDRNRSIALQRLHALAAVDALFVTLKPDLQAADREALAAFPRWLDAGGHLRDFAETAAVVEALDVVVSVDTSVAHLAGALGKPVWILLPWLPDWRWLLHREDSPWYPTARLFRQQAAGDWAPVIARVRDELAALAPAAGA